MSAPSVSQMVFLVGGLGTRLGDATLTTPKPLLDIGGRPFIEYLIAKAAGAGLSKVLLLAGRHAEKVQDYVRDSGVAGRLGVDIDVVVETVPLGTGGALMNAADRLDGEFLMGNGDSLFDFEWAEFAERTRSTGLPAGVALRRIALADRYEVIGLEGHRVTHIKERGRAIADALINGGVYCFQRSVLEGLSGAFSLESVLLPRLAGAGALAGFEYSGYFIDIGVPETLETARSVLPSKYPGRERAALRGQRAPRFASAAARNT